MNDLCKCPKCNNSGVIRFYDPTTREFGAEPCPVCGNKTAAESVAATAVPDYHIELLPVDKDELKLIKIGLFEVSEYLDSPKLRELKQRVNSLSSSIKTKLPAESIFNHPVFKDDLNNAAKGPLARVAEEWRNGRLITVSLTKEPK